MNNNGNGAHPASRGNPGDFEPVNGSAHSVEEGRIGSNGDHRPSTEPDALPSNRAAAEQNEQGDIVLRLKRSAFVDVPVDAGARDLLTRLKMPFVVKGEKVYVVGDHAFRLAKTLNPDTRPDLLPTRESDALPVMKLLIGSILGEPRGGVQAPPVPVPADSIDGAISVVCPGDQFDSALRSLGYSMPGHFLEVARAVCNEVEFLIPIKAEVAGGRDNGKLLDQVRRFTPETFIESPQDAARRRVVDFRKHALAAGRGLDVGTSSVVGSVRKADGDSLFNIQRNAFLDVRSDVFTQKMLMKLDVDHFVHMGKGFVIGDPAFELANIFKKSTRRPMKGGIISPTEPEALLVEGLIIPQVLGRPSEKGEVCAFSIPADPVDLEGNVVYHAGAIETVLRTLGYTPKPVLEGQAVVFAELAEEDYTGIGVSCGGGRINICVAYKSLPALAFSTSRGGDWIDNHVALAVDLPSSQVCAIKESGVDLNRPRDRVEEAICVYYRSLIHYSLEMIRRRFETAQSKPTFSSPITVVCSGGTSMVKGFIDAFRSEFRTIDFPIEVKEIRLARDPLRTVALGCLEAALEETRARGGAPSPVSTLERADVSATTRLPDWLAAAAQKAAQPNVDPESHSEEALSVGSAAIPVLDGRDRAHQVGGSTCR